MPKIEKYFFDAKKRIKDMITVNLDSWSVTNHYYNPDSNEGGQWVEQHWDEDLISRALKEFKDCDKSKPFSRPDCLDTEPQTYLIDITSKEFEEYETGLIEAFKNGEMIIIEDSFELEKVLKDALLKIRKNAVARENLVAEYCPHCENENIFEWDISRNGYVSFCSHCGEKLMLCSLCMGADDNPCCNCDWDDKTQSCFRCKEENK